MGTPNPPTMSNIFQLIYAAACNNRHPSEIPEICNSALDSERAELESIVTPRDSQALVELAQRVLASATIAERLVAYFEFSHFVKSILGRSLGQGIPVASANSLGSLASSAIAVAGNAAKAQGNADNDDDDDEPDMVLKKKPRKRKAEQVPAVSPSDRTSSDESSAEDDQDSSTQADESVKKAKRSKKASKRDTEGEAGQDQLAAAKELLQKQMGKCQSDITEYKKIVAKPRNTVKMDIGAPFVLRLFEIGAAIAQTSLDALRVEATKFARADTSAILCVRVQKNVKYILSYLVWQKAQIENHNAKDRKQYYDDVCKGIAQLSEKSEASREKYAKIGRFMMHNKWAFFIDIPLTQFDPNITRWDKIIESDEEIRTESEKMNEQMLHLLPEKAKIKKI